MKKVMAEVNFKGELKDFFQAIRTARELMPFDKPAQVIENFNEIHQKMKPQLAKLFDLTPKTEFEVRRTEAFREASASAEYNPGSIDGTRPGVFYVPIPDVKKYIGSNLPLQDLFSNMLLNFNFLAEASLKNQAGLKTLEQGEKMGVTRKVNFNQRYVQKV